MDCNIASQMEMAVAAWAAWAACGAPLRAVGERPLVYFVSLAGGLLGTGRQLLDALAL